MYVTTFALRVEVTYDPDTARIIADEFLAHKSLGRNPCLSERAAEGWGWASSLKPFNRGTLKRFTVEGPGGQPDDTDCLDWKIQLAFAGTCYLGVCPRGKSAQLAWINVRAGMDESYGKAPNCPPLARLAML